MAKKLYVGNLSFDVADEELEAAFSEFGGLISATVVKDRISGRSRGFGFVEFAEEENAEKAKAELNGKEIKGRAIRIDDARDQRRDQRSGGRDFSRRRRF
jgi:RNA recognition motif-containing protein